MTNWDSEIGRSLDGAVAAVVNAVASDESGTIIDARRAAVTATSAIFSCRLVLLIGNGGSMSIAQHVACDLATQANVRAEAPSDPVLNTADANDHGYVNVFTRQVSRRLRSGDVLVALSCSGESENVNRAVLDARRSNIDVVTLSGFKEDNTLRKLGRINFWVPSHSYGAVQIAHLAILHAICDALHATAHC